ncbi:MULTISPECIES: ABC transporter substrate-binding protein [Azorhizobium]|uniref:ABC transporter substrate-binding protein n=1 Tax=Azorhizobium TaxID=6 RepID=UPI00105D528E|nr:ABC transporter substrate-binding protein [Azorhizobium sp. AG788]TDT99248.1 peptide/nickel transport system substrate-binding protein [Azorhizobium sp. AG788]
MKAKLLGTLAASVALSVLAAGGAFAQQGTPKEGGRANVVIQPEPPGLMVGILQNAPTQMVAGNIYEGLLRYDEKLQPKPQLAKSWTISEDGKTYTFKLQPGVKWHDGKPFTAADVVFSADVFLRKTNPRTRASLAYVESITAPDDETVVFQLKQPFGPFIRMFEVGTMPMVPKHIYEGTDFLTNPANNTPIGTGPFKFGEWVKGSYIKLVKNPDYYEKGKPHLDEIYWHIIPDAAARAVAFETGKVDILPGGSVENFDIPRLAKTKNACITDKGWEFFAPQSWLWFNHRGGLTADPRFRKAVSYAIDRNFALDVLWNGMGAVSDGPFAQSTSFRDDKAVVKYPYDPAKAKALLKEMGYKGEPVRFTPMPYGETWLRWAEAIKQNLEDVGIKVEMVNTDVAGWNKKLGDWDFDISITFLYQYGDPALGVSRAYISSNIAKGSPFNNVGGYSNPEVDKLFAEGAVGFPDSERQKAYSAVQKKLTEDAVYDWLIDLKFPTLTHCNVKNLITTGIGVNDGFKDAWIE